MFLSLSAVPSSVCVQCVLTLTFIVTELQDLPALPVEAEASRVSIAQRPSTAGAEKETTGSAGFAGARINVDSDRLSINTEDIPLQLLFGEGGVVEEGTQSEIIVTFSNSLTVSPTDAHSSRLGSDACTEVLSFH